MEVRIGILTAPHIDWEQKEGTFVIRNVRIGIGFHWDRLEDQEFQGSLEILRNTDGTETAVNIIDMEDYLCSVISSEMAATSPMELLKAHAVISRSWLMRAIGHTDHVGYDVCADDHCQRYEGLRRMNERAVEAVRATRGQVLMYEGEICDCRYHKCCGGKTEVFSTCWEDMDVPYLKSVECPYCGRVSAGTLRQVLNNYDQETRDYYCWNDELDKEVIGERLEVIGDRRQAIGEVKELLVLKRGASGRIYELEVVGEKGTQVLSKELTIRKALSRTCLYSSWFDIEKTPKGWILHGHGWGHGVGLCQIGAAQMAVEGANYEQILSHYYPGAMLICK